MSPLSLVDTLCGGEHYSEGETAPFAEEQFAEA